MTQEPGIDFYKQDPGDGKERPYVRENAAGRRETAKRMRDLGLVKVYVHLPNGKRGFSWERPPSYRGFSTKTEGA